MLELGTGDASVLYPGPAVWVGSDPIDISALANAHVVPSERYGRPGKCYAAIGTKDVNVRGLQCIPPISP